MLRMVNVKQIEANNGEVVTDWKFEQMHFLNVAFLKLVTINRFLYQHFPSNQDSPKYDAYFAD